MAVLLWYWIDHLLQILIQSKNGNKSSETCFKKVSYEHNMEKSSFPATKISKDRED